jgi:hypothetical protein
MANRSTVREAMMADMTVLRGVSRCSDPVRAVAEVGEQIDTSGVSLTVFFCDPTYDPDVLAEAIRTSWHGPVVGCTSAGEIGPSGYISGGLVGMSLTSTALTARPFFISDVRRFEPAAAENMAKTLAPLPPGHRRFGLLLIDGLSVAEESVTASLCHAFGEIPLVGGSAGDGLRFERTAVYSAGAFASDAAVFTVVDTSLPFTTLQVQHFEPTDSRLVITGADPRHRIVTEINGGPAAEEYARAVGLDLDELTPMVFAAHPVMLRIGGEFFVRSIQKVNADGSLTFFCAIDTGLVLRVARGLDMVSGLNHALDEAEQKVGGAAAIIGCDCILRRVELEQKGRIEEMSEVVRNRPFIGFSTYGEQFGAIHVNQTFTGLVLGGAG